MNQKISVYCLPFAGGCEYSYQGFIERKSDVVNIRPIELPGRGSRIKERLLTNINHMVEDVFNQISTELTTHYAIYGHSMGSLIGYLLTKKIIQEKLPLPGHLFFSGPHEPSRSLPHVPRHLLSREDFISKLRDFGGSPDEVLDDPVLMNFYEPLLRADFEATDTYRYKPSSPFSLPITLMIGDGEALTEDQVWEWQKESTVEIDILKFSGNHFFIFDHVEEIFGIIEERLSCYTHR